MVIACRWAAPTSCPTSALVNCCCHCTSCQSAPTSHQLKKRNMHKSKESPIDSKFPSKHTIIITCTISLLLVEVAIRVRDLPAAAAQLSSDACYNATRKGHLATTQQQHRYLVMLATMLLERDSWRFSSMLMQMVWNGSTTFRWAYFRTAKCPFATVRISSSFIIGAFFIRGRAWVAMLSHLLQAIIVPFLLALAQAFWCHRETSAPAYVRTSKYPLSAAAAAAQLSCHASYSAARKELLEVLKYAHADGVEWLNTIWMGIFQNLQASICSSPYFHFPSSSEFPSSEAGYG
jgi:hypothetical protein